MEQQYLELYLFRNELIAFKPKLCPFTSAPCDHHFYQRLTTGFTNSRQTSKVFYCFQHSFAFQPHTQTNYFFSLQKQQNKKSFEPFC